MTKPTLNDFLKDGNEAISKGYKPTFMCIGAMVAKASSINSFFNLVEIYKDTLHDEVINLPINLLKIIFFTLFFITSPILFPVYWLFIYIIFKIYKVC